MILALALSLAASVSAGPARGPWLADATATTARVCWRPADASEQCRLVSALQPGATFSYFVPISTLTFTAKTLPGPGQPLRFVVVGDGGKATRGQFDVAALIERLDPDFVVHTGDIVYPRGEDRDYDAKYFEPYGRTLARRPFFHVLGNHDYGNQRSASKAQTMYENVYRRIHQRTKYYEFAAGDARFFMLDDNAAYKVAAGASLAADGDQLQWLARALAARKERWGFAVAHVPLYSTSSGHGDNALLRERLEPLFRRGALTAFFAGHDHIYQRSRPQFGILHLTVGTGGGGLSFGGHKPAWLAKEEERYGVLLVTLDARRMTGRFYGVDGPPVDEFALERP